MQNSYRSFVVPFIIGTFLSGCGSGSESDPVEEEQQTITNEAAAIVAFDNQLQGVRSYGCNPGAEGQYTTELVEVYKDGLVTSDVWLYEEPDCVTRPLTFTNTLPLQTYALEEPYQTADNRDAFKVTLNTIQVSSEAGDNAFPVGTTLYDVLALEQGGVTAGDTFATSEVERPVELEAVKPATALGARADAASMQGLQHTWLAACFNGKIQQRVFDDQQLVETVQYFNEASCERFIATKINTWNVTYGDAVTTLFGQSALRTFSELVDSRLDDVVIDSTLQAPPALSEIGLQFEDIWGVVNNELVIGTCSDKRTGSCGVGGNIPDMLNFNVGNRYVKQ